MNYLVHVPEGNLFLTGEEIHARVREFVQTCPSEFICAYRVWYEGFEGCGVVSAAVRGVIDEAIEECGWTKSGPVRFEKYGVVDPSFRNPDYANAPKEAGGRPMLQHRFQQGKHYRAPDGKIFWFPIVELFDLRGFEWADGKYVPGMVEVDPNSEYALSLEEVAV